MVEVKKPKEAHETTEFILNSINTNLVGRPSHYLISHLPPLPTANKNKLFSQVQF